MFALRALATACAVAGLVGSQAFAYNDVDFTYFNAAGVEALTSIGFLGAGWGSSRINSAYDTATASVLHSPGFAQVLTNEDIKAIVSQVDSSPLNTFGIGRKSELGGAKITITFDHAQYQRMLASGNATKILGQIATDMKMPVELQAIKDQGDALKLVLGEGSQGADAVAKQMEFVNAVKPNFATWNYNLRTIGSVGGTQGVENVLKEMQAKGVAVGQVSFKGTLAQGGKKVLVGINMLLVGEALTHGGKAVGNFIQGMEDHSSYNTAWMENNCNAEEHGYNPSTCKENVQINALTPLYDAATIYYYLTTESEPTMDTEGLEQNN